VSLDARLYALTHRGNSGDVEFYVRLCRDAASILELGCGYGRLLTALAAPGRELCGLDLDADLLQLCRSACAELPLAKRRTLELVQADMQRFAFERRFQRVLLPYNGLLCLLGPRAAARCFRAVRAVLEPGGVFAFDVWNADALAPEALRAADDDEPVARFEEGGRSWTVTERCRLGRGSQRLDVTYDYFPSGRAAPRSQCIRQRYYRSAELFGLLGAAGFTVTAKLGDFAGARFGKRSQRLVVTASAA
jgi:SAM-dependent methyltransferase